MSEFNEELNTFRNFITKKGNGAQAQIWDVYGLNAVTVKSSTKLKIQATLIWKY